MRSSTKNYLVAALGVLVTSLSAAQTAPAVAELKPAASMEELIKQAQANVPVQEWEKRRAAFADIVKGVRAGDAQSRKEFERVVRQFEAKPFDLTPLESMDLLGSVFVPQAGVEKMLPVVAAHAALGLYDALRFATPVGQAELLNGENFLQRALTMAGPEQTAAAIKFMKEQPARAAALVRQGLSLANTERQFPAYDSKWVTALGREGAFCPPGSECPKYVQPPREQWEQLWQQAAQRVAAYYVVKSDAPAAPSAASSSPTAEAR